MPPAGYLTSGSIERAIELIHDLFPSITDRFALAEPSVKGKPIHGLRIRSGIDERNGVLLVGGTHACELINPDLLVMLALKICWAYTNDQGLRFGGIGPFGGKRYTATDIKLVVDGLDVFIVPNVNPDGREYVLANHADEWDWRKNRRAHSDGSFGVDLNRNFDFVWAERIGSSNVPSSRIYQGAEPFSEPETRNVRELLRAFPRIVGLADVHSFKEAILHPWGDTDNQSEDVTQNFRNDAWDGQRDPDLDASGYREYIPSADDAKYIDRGNKVRDAIAAVRQRAYAVGQPTEILDYETSGTTRDYAYSRFFIRPNTKVWAYTIETNREGPADWEPDPDQYGFSPPYEDAARVMTEVQAGLVRFMLLFVCVVREIGRGPLGPETLGELADFREVMLRSRRGRRWAKLLDRHNDELLELVLADERLRKAAEEILTGAARIALARGAKRSPTIGEALVTRIERLAARLEDRASPALRDDITMLREDLRSVVGMTALDAIGEVVDADAPDQMRHDGRSYS